MSDNSPWRYDKFSYGVKRRKGSSISLAGVPNTSPGSSATNSPRQGPTTTTSTKPNFDDRNGPLRKVNGVFAVTESGAVSSRFVTPPWGELVHADPISATPAGPSPPPAAAVAKSRTGDEPPPGKPQRGPSPAKGGPKPEPRDTRRAQQQPAPLSPPPPPPSRGSVDLAWDDMVRRSAADGFSEDDLLDLDWSVLVDLIRHYSFSSPVTIARLSLAWKRRQVALFPPPPPVR